MTENNSLDKLGPVGRRLFDKLQAQFLPERLEIIDESALHHGHSGANPQGESHFRVIIAAGAFRGLSRVAQQRLVHETLREELAERVHALALRVEDGTV